MPLNTSARIGFTALLVAGLVACSPSGSEPPLSAPVTTPAPPASTSAAGTTTTGSPPSPSAGGVVKKVEHVFPVRSGKAHYGPYHHDYPAADIFAPCGTRVVAPYSGKISEVSRKDIWSAATNDGAERGGLSVSLVGDDGVRYYGSHLRAIEKSIKPGVVVTAGELLGHVGNTGDAAGIACHLHFGLSPACGVGDWEVRRGVVSPYRFLKAWQKGDNLSPVKTVAAWKKKNGCSA